MKSPSLPSAPAQVLNARGQPAFGTYRGQLRDLDWRRVKAPFVQQCAKQFHHKRWQYAGIAGEHFFIGVAIIDTGWCGSAFAYFFDRRLGTETAAFSKIGLPGLSTRIADRCFGDATFRSAGDCIAFRRAENRLELTVNTPQLSLACHLALPAADSVLCAIAPANWLAHSTHKSSALRVSGYADVGDERVSLDGAHASLDASNGLLARETSWRWASAHSPQIGFNLQQGYMGDAENAIWIAGEPLRVGAANISFDAAKPMAPWQISTADGLVDLQFRPEGIRRDDKDLWLAASRYQQPVGVFDGYIIDPRSRIRHEVTALAGVTEDHYSRW